MKKLHGLAALMVIAILGITGFQFYWLRQNYAREEKALAMKMDLAYRETVMQLQVSKLNLDSLELSSLPGTEPGKPAVRVIMEDKDKVKVKVSPHKKEIISTIDVVRGKLRDSLRRPGKGKGMIISMNKSSSLEAGVDTVTFTRKFTKPHGGRDYVFNLLYGVDSLRDTLRIAEIDTAYRKVLEEERLDIPFTIQRLDQPVDDFEPSFNEVTVGFANPITYRMVAGNTFPYLMKQILQPILFSLLLLGITILTFVLLYRNMIKQQRLAELKNEFISNITHELKTPIATVGVAIEALKNFNAIENPQRTKEYLDISGNELQRLSLLVDKVLKLSMFEKKEVDLKYETVDLHALVQEVLASLRLQLEKFHAKTMVRQEGNTTLQGDRLHLVSVIFNLLDNAIKYSKRAPDIEVDLREEGNNVVMRVSDNGIGIPAEYRTRIFEKFFRIPHGDTHDAKGYGLGLSYAAQVIRKHNGTIHSEDRPGGGTIFVISIPKNPVS